MSPAHSRSVITRTLTWDAGSASAAAAAAESLAAAAEAGSLERNGDPANPAAVVGFKLLALVVVVLISLLGSFLPLRLSSLSDNVRHTVMELCRFFTAGVFLGVGLLHMLPEAVEGFEELFPKQSEEGDDTGSAAQSVWASFPLAYAICCAGFVVVWFVEKRVLSAPTDAAAAAARRDGTAEGGGGVGGLSAAPLLASDWDQRRMVAVAAGAESQGGASLCVVHVSSVASYGPHSCHPPSACPHGAPPRPAGQHPLGATPASCTECFSAPSAPNAQRGGAKTEGSTAQEAGVGEPAREVAHGRGCWHEAGAPLLGDPGAAARQHSNNPRAAAVHRACAGQAMTLCPGTPPPEEEDAQPASACGACEGAGPGDAASHHYGWKSSGAWSGVAGGSPDDDCAGLHQHTHSAQHHHILMHGRGAISVLLAVVFSLHSFVVGAALGTETHPSGAVSLIIAVVAHKGAEAFAVGVQFVKEGVPVPKMVLVMLIYCAMTPLGILLGMAAMLVGGSGGAFITTTTQAFGAGTVLYIVMMELAEGGSSSISPRLQLLLLSIGLCLMAAVSVFV